MKINLANSIRKHRKNRKMTQEQLAEALGVSVGAVYKWEAGLSLPELNLIVEIADFFDESVDALLDYDMKDNRQGAIVDRLRTYGLRRENRKEGHCRQKTFKKAKRCGNRILHKSRRENILCSLWLLLCRYVS